MAAKKNTERSVAALSAIIKDFGGRYLDGTASKRIIIIAFTAGESKRLVQFTGTEEG